MPLLIGACAYAEPAIQPITKVPLTRVEIPPAKNSAVPIEVMVVDRTTQHMYVADGADVGIDVIDVATLPGRYLKTVAMPDLPRGLAIAEDLHRVYAASANGTVSVIDIDPLSSRVYTIIATVQTGGKSVSDLVEYDPADKTIYVTNPDDGFISAIDVTTNKLRGQITNLGFVEQPVYDAADGKLYVAVADRNVILAIDPKANRVVRSFDIPVNCEPHGMAINPKTNQGLLGCNYKDEPSTVAWDFKAGRMIRTFDQAGAGDLLIYDGRADQFFFAASSYAPAEVAVFNGNPLAFLTAVPTSHKSKTVAYDHLHESIYTFDGRRSEAGLWVFANPVPKK